jgi:hypothetical protein
MQKNTKIKNIREMKIFERIKPLAILTLRDSRAILS